MYTPGWLKTQLAMKATPQTEADFSTVLQMVDDQPPSDEVLKNVLEAFAKAGCHIQPCFGWSS